MRSGASCWGETRNLPGALSLRACQLAWSLPLPGDGPASRRLRVLLREASYLNSRQELKIIGLELISALDVTECLRLLAAGPGLVRGDEVNG